MISKSLDSQDYSYGIVFVDNNVMAEISVQSSVFLLQSSSMHLDPWSLLGLTTLVEAFLNSSKRGPHVWYYT